MGYDGEAIATKSRPENVQPSDMFGLVYRVPELFVGAVGMDEVVNFDAPFQDVVQECRSSWGSGTQEGVTW